jgi:uncharacterized membrane protein
MRNYNALLLFLAFLVCAAVFVVLTSLSLPDLVASHFDASGMPNGFMPRNIYIGLILSLLIVLPTLVIVTSWLAIGKPNARINIPNGGYWLAPSRRTQTIAQIRLGIIQFGAMLVSFLCYVHWLVVQANSASPSHLSNNWFIAGLAVYLVATLVWLKRMVGQFR